MKINSLVVEIDGIDKEILRDNGGCQAYTNC
jgi:hypothetical protein